MVHKFHKVYIEITNICGLECSFCPTKIDKPRVMSLEFFEKILYDIKNYTNDIALHVFGDPLSVSNLFSYIQIASKYNLNVHITTTGHLLERYDLNLFLHKSIKQINFSLNSYNKNEMKISFEEYLEPMLRLSEIKLKNKCDFFINFRLWNQDKINSEKDFNSNAIKYLCDRFNITFPDKLNQKSFRLANKILIHFDSYFQWPSLKNKVSTDGTCHGLRSQLAILSDGTVVPCCLDSFGVIDLGNMDNMNLRSILESSRSLNIINGFKQNKAVEELCQKCSFKQRFN